MLSVTTTIVSALVIAITSAMVTAFVTAITSAVAAALVTAITSAVAAALVTAIASAVATSLAAAITSAMAAALVIAIISAVVAALVTAIISAVVADLVTAIISAAGTTLVTAIASAIMNVITLHSSVLSSVVSTISTAMVSSVKPECTVGDSNASLLHVSVLYRRWQRSTSRDSKQGCRKTDIHEFDHNAYRLASDDSCVKKWLALGWLITELKMKQYPWRLSSIYSVPGEFDRGANTHRCDRSATNQRAKLLAFIVSFDVFLQIEYSCHTALLWPVTINLKLENRS
jgi:hypothetical protein